MTKATDWADAKASELWDRLDEGLPTASRRQIAAALREARGENGKCKSCPEWRERVKFLEGRITALVNEACAEGNKRAREFANAKEGE